MNITKHTKVLSVLEMRAQRYRRKGQQLVDADQRLMDQAIDETGTVDTTLLSDSDDDSTQNTLAEHEFLREKGIADELLNVHGVAPSRKPEGVSRLIFENPNGFSTTISGNEKLEKAKEISDELEADIVGYSETRINGRHKQNVNGLSQMFRGGEAEIRTVAGHNVHENVSRFQEGGTAALLYGPLIEQ